MMRRARLLCIVALGFGGCTGGKDPEAGAPSAKGADEEAEIREFCSTCHLRPPPDILPRSEWKKIVELMYSMAEGGSEVAPESFPPMERVIDHYTRQAPERLAAVDSTAIQGPGNLQLRRIPLRLHGLEPYPAVANVQFVRLTDAKGKDLMVCDMRYGMVFLLQLGRQEGPSRVHLLGKVPHPCHAELADLDGDGHTDILVANLGTVTPSDATNGSVEWLRGNGTLKFRRHTLASGLGRVSDIRVADFDGDGDRDLMVAIFGWRKIGEIVYFENRTKDASKPEFRTRVIDERHGSIHVPIADLNGDGRPDFIGLISQQHETVVAYLNLGSGFFQPEVIFLAEYPTWGSSGIDLVDFDGDGDLDVLYANGDTLDDYVPKPYHGVQWLENRGEFPYVHHRLTDLYGTHFAKAGDLDGDGDTDVVACAFLPFVRRDMREANLVESVIWLEGIEPGKFARHSIEARTPYHATLDLGDYDGDGDLDIVVGNMTLGKEGTDTIEDWLMLFQNQRK